MKVGKRDKVKKKDYKWTEFTFYYRLSEAKEVSKQHTHNTLFKNRTHLFRNLFQIFDNFFLLFFPCYRKQVNV